MTPEAIGLIKASHAQATATPRQLADRFYEHLFAAEPSLRRLFPPDLTLLEGHFEAALALVVRNLDEMSALRESLRDLGAQHVHWGARPEDYVTVILPEFVPARWWQHLLHNQRALLIKGALLFRPNTVVTSVPFHLAK